MLKHLIISSMNFLDYYKLWMIKYLKRLRVQLKHLNNTALDWIYIAHLDNPVNTKLNLFLHI